MERESSNVHPTNTVLREQRVGNEQSRTGNGLADDGPTRNGGNPLRVVEDTVSVGCESVRQACVENFQVPTEDQELGYNDHVLAEEQQHGQMKHQNSMESLTEDEWFDALEVLSGTSLSEEQREAILNTLRSEDNGPDCNSGDDGPNQIDSKCQQESILYTEKPSDSKSDSDKESPSIWDDTYAPLEQEISTTSVSGVDQGFWPPLQWPGIDCFFNGTDPSLIDPEFEFLSLVERDEELFIRKFVYNFGLVSLNFQYKFATRRLAIGHYILKIDGAGIYTAQMPIFIRKPYVSGYKMVIVCQDDDDMQIACANTLSCTCTWGVKTQTPSIDYGVHRLDYTSDNCLMFNWAKNLISVFFESSSYSNCTVMIACSIRKGKRRLHYELYGEKEKGHNAGFNLVYDSDRQSYKCGSYNSYLRVDTGGHPQVCNLHIVMTRSKTTAEIERKLLLRAGDVELNPGPLFAIPDEQINLIKTIADDLQTALNSSVSEIRGIVEQVLSKIETNVTPTKLEMVEKFTSIISTLYLLYVVEDNQQRLAVVLSSRLLTQMMQSTWMEVLLKHFRACSQHIELQASIVDDLTTAIVQFFRIFTNWELPKSLIEWSTLTRLVDSLLRLPHDFIHFVKIMINILRYLVDKVWMWLVGVPFTNAGKWENARPIISSWFDDVQAATAKPINTWVTIDGYAQLKDLIDSGKVFMSQVLDYKTAKSIREVYNRLLPIYQNITMMRSMPKNRVRPVVIMLTGKSGVGKSTLIDVLCKDLNELLGLGYPQDSLKYVHDHNSDEFFNGYYGQMCYVGDEAFSVADKELVEKEGIAFFSMANVATMMTNQADVDMKGRVPFVSPLMICTTNRTNFCNDQGFNRTDAQAFVRRVDLFLQVQRPNSSKVLDRGLWVFRSVDEYGNDKESYNFGYEALLERIKAAYNSHVEEYQRLVADQAIVTDLAVAPGKYRRLLVEHGLVDDNLVAGPSGIKLEANEYIDPRLAYCRFLSIFNSDKTIREKLNLQYVELKNYVNTHARNLRLLKVLTASLVSGALIFSLFRWYRHSRHDDDLDFEDSGVAQSWGKERSRGHQQKRGGIREHRFESDEVRLIYDESKPLDDVVNQVIACYPEKMRERILVACCDHVGDKWFVRDDVTILPPYGYYPGDRIYFGTCQNEDLVKLGDEVIKDFAVHRGPAYLFLEKYCKTNFGSIECKGQVVRKAKTWFLDGKTFVTNKHIIQDMTDDTIFQINVKGGVYQIKGQSLDIDCAMGSDICVVTMSKDTPIEGIPSTVKYLPAMEDLLPSYEVVYTIREERAVVTYNLVGVCNRYGIDFMSDKIYDGRITYRAPAESKPGDCGCPYIAEVNGKPLILGFHFAKTPDDYRLIGVCTSDLLRIKSGAMELQGLAVPNNIFVKRINDPKDRSHLPSDTKICPCNTELDEIVEMAGGDNRRKPAILRAIDGVSPAEKAIAKFDVLDYKIPIDVMSYPIDIQNDSLLSWEEAAFGCDDITGWRSLVMPLDFTTSAGYNWRTSGKGKGKLFPRVEGKRIISEELMIACQNLEREMQRAPVSQKVFDVLKDELRPIEKVNSFSTRIVSVLNVEFSMLIRRYCSSIINSLYMDPNVCVGINPHSSDWTNLYKRLKFDTQPDWTTYCGDFSGFDRTISDDFIHGFFYRGDHKYRLMRSNIAKTIVRLTHIMSDVEFKGHGNPSGMPATTALNSWVNATLITSFFNTFGLKQGEHYVFCVYGDDSVIRYPRDIFRIMFDDGDLRSKVLNLNEPKGKLREHSARKSWLEDLWEIRESFKKKEWFEKAFFCFPQFYYYLQSYVKQYGFVLTQDKNAPSTFLKRSFNVVKHEGIDVVLAPLPVNIIADMVLWYRKAQNLSKQQAIRERVTMAMAEAFHHGKEFYDKFVGLVKHLVQPEDVVSWEALMSRFQNGTMAEVFEVPELSTLVSWIPAAHALNPSLKKVYKTKNNDVRGFITLEMDEVETDKVQSGPQGAMVKEINEQEDQAHFADVAAVQASDKPNMVNIDAALPSSDYEQQLSRPYVVADFVWDGTNKVNDLLTTIRFPAALFNQLRIANILSRYAYFRADVHIQVRLNCNRFQYGALIASWLPYSPEDTIVGGQTNTKYQENYLWSDSANNGTYFGGARWQTQVDHFNNPHCVISCQNNPVIEFDIQTVLPYEAINIALCMPTVNWQDNTINRYFASLFSTMWLHVWVPLTNVSGTSSSSCQVQVLANFTNVKVYANSYNMFNPIRGSVRLEGLEDVLHVVGDTVKTSIPGLAKTIDTVKGIGRALGWDKPSQESVINVYSSQTRDVPTMGSSNALVTRLGQYSSTILKDYSRMGDTTTNIEQLANKEFLVYQFSFNDTTAANTMLFNIPVGPYPSLVASKQQNSATFLYLGYFPYISSFFSYWRANVKVRIKFYASAYHQARLLLVWSPTPTVPQNPLNFYGDLLSLQMNIVDGEADFILDIPWCQQYKSKFTWIYSPPETYIYANGSMPTLAASSSNGFLSLFVMNPVVSSLTNASAPIYCQVFYSFNDAHLYQYIGLCGSIKMGGNVSNPNWTLNLQDYTDEVTDYLEVGKRYTYNSTNAYWTDQTEMPFIDALYYTPSLFPSPAFAWTQLAQVAPDGIAVQNAGLGTMPMSGTSISGLSFKPVTFGNKTVLNTSIQSDDLSELYTIFGMYRFWKGSMRYKIGDDTLAFSAPSRVLRSVKSDDLPESVHNHNTAGISYNNKTYWPFNEVEVPFYSNWEFGNIWTVTPYYLEDVQQNALYVFNYSRRTNMIYSAIGDDFKLGGLCSPPCLARINQSLSPLKGSGPYI